MTKSPELLEQYEENWKTSMGGWLPKEGKVYLRGKEVLTQLKEYRWHQYLLYGVTGIDSKKLARLYEGIWVISCSFPDPRLWNNQVAALGGTARSTGALSTAGALAVTEATIYGLKPIKGVMDFIYRAAESLDSGNSLEDIIKSELKKYRSIYGYGRPLRANDERVVPLMDFAHSIGAGAGPYTKLAFKIDDYMKASKYGYRINIAGVSAALVADEGITAEQHYHMASVAFSAGIIPCYIDSASKPEGAFFPFRISSVKYSGAQNKKSWGGNS